MFTKRLVVVSWFTLTMVLAAANWIDAAEPIIVFQSNRDGDDELFLAMDDGTVKQFTKNRTDDQQPAWSPDGNQIVWLHPDCSRCL